MEGNSWSRCKLNCSSVNSHLIQCMLIPAKCFSVRIFLVKHKIQHIYAIHWKIEEYWKLKFFNSHILSCNLKLTRKIVFEAKIWKARFNWAAITQRMWANFRGVIILMHKFRATIFAKLSFVSCSLCCNFTLCAHHCNN